MNKYEIDFLNQLIPQISKRVSEKRKSLKCIEIKDETSGDSKYITLESPLKVGIFKLDHTKSNNRKSSCRIVLSKSELRDLERNIKKKVKQLPQVAVTKDRSKLSEIERGISRKKSGVDSNFMPYYIADDIDKKLNILQLELYYGDVEAFYTNVKWIFFEIAFNLDIVLYDFNNTSTNRPKYPNLISVTESLYNLLMFDGELSAMYETAQFEENSGLLVRIQNGYVEEKEKYRRKLKEATEESDREILQAQLKSLDAHDNHVEKEWEIYKQANEAFKKRYAEIVEWVWQKEKDYFVQSFIHNVVQKNNPIKTNDYIELKNIEENKREERREKVRQQRLGKKIEENKEGDKEEDKEKELKFNLLKINKNVTEWVDISFYEIIKELKESYVHDDIFGIGYQISDVLSRRTQIWLDRIFKESKTNNQILETYEDFAQKMIELQRDSWNSENRRK